MPWPRRGLLQSLGFVTLTLVALTLGVSLAAEGVVNVAHRGGISPDYPENSLAAFRHAIAAGADMIELDLRPTRDGEIVILHDETLDRTTEGTGKVTDHTLDEVTKLGVATYREALELCAGSKVGLLLDIKVSPLLDKRKVVQLTRDYGAEAIVGVRTVDDLGEFRRLAPEWRTLAFVPSAGTIEDFVAAGANIVRLWPRWIEADPSLVKRVHEMGKPVWTTSNDAPAAELKKLIAAGVDGIITDYPETLARLIRK